MLMQNATGYFCAGQRQREPRVISVPGSTFFECGMLIKKVRKALLKNSQASSTDGRKSISFQDTTARSIRKACSLKFFRERLTVMSLCLCGRLTA